MEQIIAEEVDQQDFSARLENTSTSFPPHPLESTQDRPSSSRAGPVSNVLEDLPAETELTQHLQRSSPPLSPSLLSPTTVPVALPAVRLITPEVIRPHPRVDRSMLKKSKTGKLPGKSRIYTDTPEKNRLAEIEQAKKLKKQEQERKQRAKEMKRALNLISDINEISKLKKQKKTLETSKSKKQKKNVKTDDENETDCEEETDYEDEANVSLRQSSCSPIEETPEGSDIENETPVMSENIREESFVLVKFERKKTVRYYVGQVLKKYSPMEYKVSFLRKKPSSLVEGKTWKFVFPTTKDEGTVSLSDVVCILPPSKSALTARTANIYSFERDLSMDGSWPELIKKEISLSKTSYLPYDALVFRNYYVLDGAQKDLRAPKEARKLAHTWRARTPSPPGYYVKSFFNTSSVTAMHNHTPLKCWRNCNKHDVNDADARLMHFREQCAEREQTCAALTDTVRDDVLMKWRPQVLAEIYDIMTKVSKT